jgi:hypothetical protein
MKHHGYESGVTAVHPDGPMGAPVASDASRREFLKTLAAVGAGAVLPASGLLAQTARGLLAARPDGLIHTIMPTRRSM